MGSLYDNSGEDIYARRDIEKRRKHAMAMKKKRKRQILKRKIMLFTGAAAILVASLGLTAAVRKNNTASGSSLNPKETQQVAIDANADAANDDNIDKKDEKKDKMDIIISFPCPYSCRNVLYCKTISKIRKNKTNRV